MGTCPGESNQDGSPGTLNHTNKPEPTVILPELIKKKLQTHHPNYFLTQ